MKASTKNTFRYFIEKIKKHPWLLFIDIVTVSLGVITFHLAQPFLIKKIIDTMTDSSINKTDAMSIIGTYFSWIIVAYIIGFLAWRIGGLIHIRFNARIMKEISIECYNTLLKQSFSFFSNTFIGSLVAKVSRLVWGFDRLSDILFYNLLTTFIKFIGAAIILWFVFPFAAYALPIFVFIYILTIYKFSVWKVKYDRKSAFMDSSVRGRIADGMTNFLNVKIFARRNYENESFKELSKKEYKARVFSWDLTIYAEIIQGIFLIIVELLIIHQSIQQWNEGIISIGTIVLIQGLLLPIFRDLWEIGRMIRDTFKTIADCEEMIEILYETPATKDIKNTEKCKIKEGNVELKNVNFIYEGKNQVFKDFNVSLKSGEKVGLVGESGSGKTTLTKILLRFNDIESGEVLIDGQNIAHIKQDDLRKNISYVPQDPILFHRSLMENIQYGDLTASTEEVFQAAKRAHAHEFIMNTADKYDTLVGERGIKLSGGERQRISIARAMLKKSPLLILDEATSALDSNAEKLIQEALDDIMQGRTTLVIAHRLSTLRKMDRIIVLDKGAIAETGSHEELLQKNGKYAELWNHQVGGFIG